MAKTGAERQAAYRARQAGADSGQRRISTWISIDAALALEEMSHRYGVTMRDAIEMLLLPERENKDKHLIGNKIPKKKKAQRSGALRRNESGDVTIPVSSIDSIDVLLRNAEVATIPPQLPARIETEMVAEPRRGEQYSLEL